MASYTNGHSNPIRANSAIAKKAEVYLQAVEKSNGHSGSQSLYIYI